MATTKLVSANMGIVLIVEKDGERKRIDASGECPHGFDHPSELLQAMCDLINDEFGTNYHIQSQGLRSDQNHPVKIKFAKPKRIKAKDIITHDEFNHKIKELMS